MDRHTRPLPALAHASARGAPGSVSRSAVVRRRAVLGLGLAAVLVSLAPDTVRPEGVPQAPTNGFSGVRLVMVDEAGCPYCARWDAEVGVGYPNSAEGRFAPLVRIRIGHPDLARFGRLVYTPTFLVVRDGAEVGRIVGYPGAHFFWPMLTEILAKTGFKPAESRPGPSAG